MGKNSSRPFVQSRATGTAGQKWVIDVAAAGLPEGTRAFLAHLVASTLAAVVGLVMARREGHAFAAPSVPISTAFIRENFRGAAWPELVSRGMDTWSALGLAYSTVVVPTLKAQQATQFVQDAVKKAQASTNNPAVTAPIVTARPRSFGEAFAQLRKAR